MENHFYYPKEGYGRTLDMQHEAIADYALMLSKARDIPMAEAERFVIDAMRPGGALEMKDPRCLVLTQRTEGNREAETIKFNDYLSDIKENRFIVSPVWVNYKHPEDELSILSEFAIENTNDRKAQKKKMFKAKAVKDLDGAEFWNQRQTNTKVDNNSLSGAQASAFNPLVNPSAHPTLTSTCRCASGSANANNERFLAGNYHYYDSDVAFENIVSVIRNSDLPAIERVMQKYNLHYPTAEEAWTFVYRSTSRYWYNPRTEAIMRDFLTKVTPLERAAYMYTNDFYTLRIHNQDFVRTMLDELSSLPTEPLATMEEAEEWVEKMDGNMSAWIAAQCAPELWIMKENEKTKKMERAALAIWQSKEEKPMAYRYVGATAKLMFEYLNKYSDIISTLWRTENQPAAVYAFPAAQRDVGVLSDTDSTVFTGQEWVQWRWGTMDINEKSIRTANTLVFLVTQITVHLLAQCSANMGVATKDMYMLEMKNEYMFLILALTSMGKNYYGYMTMQEGIPIDPYKLELKGPVLRDGSAPKVVTERVMKMLRQTMDNVLAGKTQYVRDVLADATGLEDEILASVKRGDPEYLTRVKVKSEKTYTNAMKVPAYQSYVMWQEVFADKYGQIPPPPYIGVRVPLDAGNKTLMNEWLEGWEDQHLATKFRTWMKSMNKDKMENIIIPHPIVEGHGIPDIFIQGMNIRRLIATLMRSYYALLESYGLFMVNKHNTMLAKDLIVQLDPTFEVMQDDRSAGDENLLDEEIKEEEAIKAAEREAFEAEMELAVERGEMTYTEVRRKRMSLAAFGE